MKKAIIYVLYFVGIQLIVSSICTLIFNLLKLDALSVNLLILSSVVSAVVTIALFLWRKYTAISPAYLRTWPWAVFVFSILASIGSIIPSEWFQEQLPPLPNIVEEQMTMLMKSSYGFFVVGILAPFCEELVFRGAILHSLLGWSQGKNGWLSNHWSMIAISAILFALIHFNPAQMPHALLVGLLLGWMYYRTDSILPGVALHWTNNTVAYITCSIFPDPNAHLSMILGGDRNVIFAILYSMCILVPSIYMLNKYMKKAS